MEDKISNQETILNSLRNWFGKNKTFDLDFPHLRVERIDGNEKHIWNYELKFQLVDERLCRIENK